MSYIYNRIIETFDGLFKNIYIPQINLYDIIEISIIIVLFYFLAKAFKNTRTWVLVKGSVMVAAVYLITYLLSFHVITKIFESILILLVVGIVVIFSPEIKKFLENIGTKKIKNEFLSIFQKGNQDKNKITPETIAEIVAACEQMSHEKTGALIVYENAIPLNEYADTGIKMNSCVSRQLLLNIFEHNTPLHDGAVIIKEDEIQSATCYLPLSENKKISKKLGTRHRAGLGISEATDALTIIVSEETGRISIAKNGVIKSVTAEGLEKALTEFQNETVSKEKKKFSEIVKNNFLLKLTSVALGLICWTIIMSTSNPLITTTISSVPITVTNEQAITNMDKVFSIDESLYTTVKVTGHRSSVEKLTAHDIRVIADLSLLSEINTVRLTASSTDSSVSVHLTDEILQVGIEKCVEKEFDVKAQKNGLEDPSVYVYDIKSSTPKITVKGPESIIKNVDNVKFIVDVNDCKGDTKYTARALLYDKDEKLLATKNIKISHPELEFEILTHKTKTVPLIATPQCSSNIKKYINTFSAVPSNIVIAADEKLLNKTKSLNISVPVDLNTQDLFEETYTKEIDVSEYVSDGIFIPDANREVDIVIGFASDAIKEITFNFEDIELKNFDSTKYSFKTPQNKFTTSVFGDKDAILEADITTIKPYIDFAGAKVGENILYIEYETETGLKISSNNKVKITIEEVKQETTYSGPADNIPSTQPTTTSSTPNN